MKKATLPKINGTLPAKMLASLCVLNCVGAVTPPAEESALLETKSTAAAPSLKNCVALETKCKKKDLWEVTKSCGVEEIEKKCMNLCKANGEGEALSKNCKKACCVLPLIVATLPGTEAGKRTKSHRQRLSAREAQIAINSSHGGRRKGSMTGDRCIRPAETYCIGGSHTPKAERVGRHICSVLGTHCHLTDGVWADNASAPSFFNRVRVPSQWRHTYSLKALGTIAAHYDAWGAMSAQGTSTSKEWVVVLEGTDAMLNPLLSLGSAKNMTRVVRLGLKEALCSQAAVKRGLVYLGRCSNALKLPNATALYPDSCAEHQSLAAFEGKLTVASCTNTLCTHAYAIQRRVASDLYSNLFATYNVCSFHRCSIDRALDVYTKVVKKHPAAVVLHASNKRHVFMSYDGLFVQRKGGFI